MPSPSRKHSSKFDQAVRLIKEVDAEIDDLNERFQVDLANPSVMALFDRAARAFREGRAIERDPSVAPEEAFARAAPHLDAAIKLTNQLRIESWRVLAAHQIRSAIRAVERLSSRDMPMEDVVLLGRAQKHFARGVKAGAAEDLNESISHFVHAIHGARRVRIHAVAAGLAARNPVKTFIRLLMAGIMLAYFLGHCGTGDDERSKRSFNSVQNRGGSRRTGARSTSSSAMSSVITRLRVMLPSREFAGVSGIPAAANSSSSSSMSRTRRRLMGVDSMAGYHRVSGRIRKTDAGNPVREGHKKGYGLLNIRPRGPERKMCLKIALAEGDPSNPSRIRPQPGIKM
ncbi:MAG: hypothetical protein R2834_11640 [Rhodothermales bacterium]